MKVSSILLLGNPELFEKSQAIDSIKDPETQEIVEKLIHTKASLDPIAGLAAPQIGLKKRIIIFEAPAHRRDGGEVVPVTVAINPKILWQSEEKVRRWESCLSLPDFAVEVCRPQTIHYQYFTPEGKKVRREASGFHAKVVQHEIDHLDGILSIQRMDDPTRFGYISEIEKYYL